MSFGIMTWKPAKSGRYTSLWEAVPGKTHKKTEDIYEEENIMHRYAVISNGMCM